MKKPFQITMSSMIRLLAIFGFSLALSQVALAEGTYEVTCRIKAKEIAAETYKGCMTENRQTQLEQIRKDYKDELARVKSNFDKKLQKLSGKNQSVETSGSAISQPAEVAANATIELRKLKTRGSGARMPLKKNRSGTQVIDLSRPVDGQINEPAEITESARVEKRDRPESDDVEIVEIPSQE